MTTTFAAAQRNATQRNAAHSSAAHSSERRKVIAETYTAKQGLNNKAAQLVGEVQARLAEEGRGTPAELVAAARPKDSPIHHLPHWKGWRVKDAAEAYFLEVARYYWRIIVVKRTFEDGETEAVRAFHVVREVHVAVRQVQEDTDYTAQVIAQAQSELRAFQRKYTMYRQLFVAFEERFGTAMDAIAAATNGEDQAAT